MNSPLARYLPWGVVAVAALYLATAAFMPAVDHGPMHLQAFGRLPVMDGGRIKPLDTVARQSLMLISGKQTFRDANDAPQPAIKWLLDVMVSPPGQPGPAEKYKVFRIENEEVLSLLGLTPRSGFRYALEEFFPKLEDFDKQVKRAQNALKAQPDKKLDIYDTKLLETAEHFNVYAQLASLRVASIPPVEAGGKWQAYGAIEEEAKQTALARIRLEVARAGIDFKALDDHQLKVWGEKFFAEKDRVLTKLTPPAGVALVQMLDYYKDNKADQFNQAVADYATNYANVPAGDVDRAGFEVFFDHFAPFYACIVLYVFAFLLACIGWITFTGPLHRAAFWLVFLTLIVHTWALLARMYLSGRPPVTNLYSSAVFIGWGCVGLGLILERFSRIGLATALAATMGAATLVIAHFLGLNNDTLEPMQAVLATNFWLATHVTCVTFGYTATFVAGFLGMIFILLGVFTPWLNRDVSVETRAVFAGRFAPFLSKNLFKALGQMIYGVICFATLLSFVGTVLGGIWADQSWGRFWGWDPKENGALLIVLSNALILHARWGGLVKQRGMAVLAVFGNIVTAWSWFGVNMLGVGLHSYGFIAAAVYGMLAFAASQLAVIAVGCLPLRMWRSFQPRQASTLADAPTPASVPRTGRGPSTAITPAS